MEQQVATRLLAIANNAFRSYKRANYVIDMFESVGLLVDGSDSEGFGELYGIMTSSVDAIMMCFDISGEDSLVEKVQAIIESDIDTTDETVDRDKDFSDSAVAALVLLGRPDSKSILPDAE